jgi:hypothetical protein
MSLYNREAGRFSLIASQKTAPPFVLIPPEIMHTIGARIPSDERVYRCSKDNSWLMGRK